MDYITWDRQFAALCGLPSNEYALRLAQTLRRLNARFEEAEQNILTQMTLTLAASVPDVAALARAA